MSEIKMSENKRDYEVGRGKPPVPTRFKKGQSGNPRGPRPKKPAGIAARRAQRTGGHDALVPIGWPLDRFGPLTHRPLAEVAHADRWGTA